MLKGTNVHSHLYTKIGFIREVGTVPNGSIINRIILTRTCDCGESQAFDTGSKDKMRIIYERLATGQNNAVLLESK